MPPAHTAEYRAQLQSNHARLMEQVRPIAAVSADTTDLSEGLAQRLPLSHSMGAATFLKIIKKGSLLSYPKLEEAGVLEARRGAPPTVESLLRTEDFVFTYAAPFRYPMTDCGFLFRAEVEKPAEEHAVATPFDSGATVRHLRPRDSTVEQVAFVRSHELPVPGYREYLALLLTSFFSSPWDYLDGIDPLDSWPIAVESGDWRWWTFEVRFRDELKLQGSLMAVFLASDIASQDEVLGQIERWEAAGVDVVEYIRSRQGNSWQALQLQSIEYLKRYLS